MLQQQMVEGTGAELQEHLKQHPDARFRLILLPQDGSVNQVECPGLRQGMFPQLKGLTEADFEIAEWRPSGSLATQCDIAVT